MQKLRNIFVITFFSLFFVFILNSQVKAGDEACTNPSYPTCWPSRVINEYVCSTMDSVSQTWVCSEGNDRKWDTNNCNNYYPDEDAYCDALYSGYTCEHWWLLPSGAYVDTINYCKDTGTVFLQCTTSTNSCSVKIENYKECSIQSSSGSCSEDVITKTYSCCGGDTPPGETPPPGGGGCTDPNDIPVPEVDCTKAGFYGKYAASNGVYATAYLCDPDSSKGTSKEVCDSWNSTWDGYWNIPVGQGGEYDFHVVFNPILTYKFDIDGGGTFNSSCPNPLGTAVNDPIVGDYYFFLATGCTACKQAMYRPRWINSWVNTLSYFDSASANCESVPTSQRTGKGEHLETVDENTVDASLSCGTGWTGPVDTPWKSTTECLISAWTTDPALNKINKDTTDRSWIVEGYGHSYFTRDLAEGPHKVSLGYTSRYGDDLNSQALDIYYRKKGSATWIALKNLSDANCPISPCKSACTLSLTPATKTMTIGGATQKFTASLTGVSGTIEKVTFAKNNAKININTTNDTTSPYETTATAVSAGTSVITASAYISGLVSCSDTSTITVNAVANTDPWWQVKDADVITNGDLISSVISGQFFDIAGAGGYPGVPSYGDTATIPAGRTSPTGWIAKSNYSSSKIFNPAYFINAIPSDITGLPNITTDTDVTDSDLSSGGVSYGGYFWYEYDGDQNSNAPLNITENVTLGTRKVILIVKNADLNIGGKINLADGQGFFLAVVDKKNWTTGGNINVDAVVGGATPSLEGVYITDKKFQTGTGGAQSDTQLRVRGIIAAFGGVNLQRDLGTTNSTTPGEYFEFAPDQELLFPIDLAYRVMNWREVAP